MPDGTAPVPRPRRSWKVITTLVVAAISMSTVLFASGGVKTVNAAAGTATLNPGEWLYPGQSLYAANGGSRLSMQTDGNLVEYNYSGQAIWWPNYPNCSPTCGTVGQNVKGVTMQTDGNLVIYLNSGGATWWPGWPTCCGTPNHPGAHLVDQADENIVIYPASGPALWATNTYQTYVITGQGTFSHQASATFTFWYTEYEESGSVIVPYFFADNSNDLVNYQIIYWSTQNKSYIVWQTDYFWNDVTNGQQAGLPFDVIATDRHDHDEWWGRSNQFTRYTVYPANAWNAIGGNPVSDSILAESNSVNDAYWEGAIVAYPGAVSQDACCGSTNTQSPAITAPNLGN